MLYIISFILFLLSIYIIKDKEKCLYLFLMGLTLFNNKFALGPLHTNLLFTIALTIAFLSCFGTFKKKEFFKFPFKTVFLLFCVSILLVGVFDSRHTISSTIVNPTKYIFQTFTLLFVAYCLSFKKRIQVNAKMLIVVLLSIEFGFGIFEVVTSYNPIKELTASLSPDEEYQLLTDNWGRYRVSSLQDSPFNYGFYSSIFGLMLLYYAKISKRNSASIMALAFVAGFGGSILSGSRSAILSCALSYMLYVLASYKIGKVIKSLLLIIPITLILINLSNGMFDELFQSLYDGITTGGKKSVGSTSEMRMIQMAAVLKYFSEAPIFGNGIFFFTQVLGWGTGKLTVADTDLYGLEGLHYSILLEQGIVGVVAHIVMFGAIIKFLWRHRTLCHDEAYLGLSIMCLFLTWALLTGAQGAWYPTMFFLGIIISSVQKKKYEAISNSNTCV